MYVCMYVIEHRRHQLYHQDLQFMYVCMRFIAKFIHDSLLRFFLKGIFEHTQVGQRGGQIDSTAPVEVFGELRS